jgi:ubiquinone/menaquinone biosynthesis C-methylase UbiE
MWLLEELDSWKRLLFESYGSFDSREVAKSGRDLRIIAQVPCQNCDHQMQMLLSRGVNNDDIVTRPDVGQRHWRGAKDMPKPLGKDQKTHWSQTYESRGDIWHAMYPNGYSGFEGLRKLSQMLEPNAAVLEVGIGTGEAALLLLKRGAHVTGVDFSSEAIELCKVKFKKEYIPEHQFELNVASIEELELENSRFDCVLDYYASQHLARENQLDFFRRAYRFLKPSGLLLIGQFSQDHIRKQGIKEVAPGTFSSETGHFFCLLGSETLSRLLRQIGFRIVGVYETKREGFFELLAAKPGHDSSHARIPT